MGLPASRATCHIEKSTPKKQHKKALAAAMVEPFTLYTFRHRIGHSESETAESVKASAVTTFNNSKEINGRGE